MALGAAASSLAEGCPSPIDTRHPSSICTSVGLRGSGHTVPRDKETVSAALEGLPILAAFMEVQPRVCCAFTAFLGLWRRKRRTSMHFVSFVFGVLSGVYSILSRAGTT